MQFAYTARSSGGESLEGTVAAHSVEQVRQLLRRQGAMAVSIRELQTAGRTEGRRRASARELLGVTSQLAIMTRTGIDLASAIHSVAGQCKNPRLSTVLDAVHQDVANGSQVSRALGRHVDVFGESYVAAVAAGEASGGLSEILVRLSDQLKNEIRNRNMVRQLLAYPLMLICVSSVVLIGLVMFVLPNFAAIYDQYHMPLPWTTRALMSLSQSLRQSLPLLTAVSAAAALAAVWFWVSGRAKKLRDRCLLHLPVVRQVARPVLGGRMLTTLGNVLQSGVPLLEGVRLTRASVNNLLFKEMFADVEQEILNGRGLRRPLLSTEILPDGAAEMLLTGEQTGTLEEVTTMMGVFYEEQGEAKLRELASLVEPLIIVTMGVIVGIVVVSVMLPIFDMATIVN